MNRLIESSTVERDYGFRGVEAIIETDKYGRVFIADGFGGMNTIYGGAVRWEHGYAVRIKPDDTLALLNDQDDRGVSIMYHASVDGDKSRPGLWLTGQQIASLAKSAGL